MSRDKVLSGDVTCVHPAYGVHITNDWISLKIVNRDKSMTLTATTPTDITQITLTPDIMKTTGEKFLRVETTTAPHPAPVAE